MKMVGFEKKPNFLGESLKMIFPLIVIAAISGGIIAIVYSLTEGQIEQQKKQQIEQGIFSIMPEIKYIEETTVGAEILYKCRDQNKEDIAIAFTAEGPGYQDVIKVLAVVSNDLSSIKGIEILENVETPGLGAKITTTEFKEQFKNTSSSLKLSKEISQKGANETTVQAITGATISSNAVIDIINSKIAELKKIVGVAQ